MTFSYIILNGNGFLSKEEDTKCTYKRMTMAMASACINITPILSQMHSILTNKREMEALMSSEDIDFDKVEENKLFKFIFERRYIPIKNSDTQGNFLKVLN